MFVATIQPLKFQSTLPRGERRHEVQQQTQVRDFNPRSHEGSDVHRIVYRRSICTDFNPRSHEGSDTAAKEIFDALDISIHAPTRGATC